ncbi:MAG: GTP cyclohydrolase I FolE [Desulfitobacteriaceae bacterium]|nr:GTP cyclohydrolase I FolE [Desulfitobacteriaceae bacterium]MDD4346989.1 GTP cyclohydrolase I FolE [Desulfitobacteriaceae bacterium]MDD4401718.1 GTP cyclohydrolase I FolE [Desulfitobacteriaceae bacterium]
MDREKIEKAVLMILEAIGEDPQREGLRETPKRLARMYEEIFSGLEKDPSVHLKVQFSEEHEEMVIVKDIPVYSMCEHHFVPFYGKAHVAYIPRRGKVTGLSKLARVVEGFAKRPQLQERLTSQIADTIMKMLNPRGVLVVIEAEHMCMTMRGVKIPGSQTITSAVRGMFQSSQATRAEGFALIHGHL